MGSPSRPSLPNTPTFQSNPNVGLNIDRLSELAQGLTSGGFLNANDSQLGFLNTLVNPQNSIIQQAMDLAGRGTQRAFDQNFRQTINQLEANNQLTSSSAVNRLADLNQNFSQDIADINTRVSLDFANTALGNISNLFGAGLNATSTAAQLGLSDQSQRNQFNLENFGNQIAASEFGEQDGRGGLFGGLGGAGLGAILGTFAFPGVGTALGASLGGSLGSGIGEAISPSRTGAVATSFGSGALGMLGQQAALGSQSNMLDRILQARGLAGTGVQSAGGLK